MTAPHFSTGTANFGPNVLTTVYLQKMFEDPLHADLIAYPLGKVADLPEGMGKTVRWNRMQNPSAQTTSIAEDTPGTTTLTTATVTATVADYGRQYVYSAFLEKTAIKDTIPEIVRQAGYEAALTVETLTYTQALTDATQIDAGVALTAETIRIGVATLEGLDAKRHPMCNGFFGGIFSAEQLYDMMGEGAPTWVQAKRGDLQAAMVTPWTGTPASAAIYNCLLKQSSVVTTQSAASEEFGYIIGKDSFGTVALTAGNLLSPRVVVTPPEARVDRATRDQGTIGWLVFYVSELLNANSIREIKSDIG